MITPILVILYVIIFFGAVFYSVNFQFRKESKDERGQRILTISQSAVFPLLIPAAMLIQFIIKPETVKHYADAVWFMVTGIYIMHAVILFVAKRRI